MYRHAFQKSSRCQYRTPSGKRCRFNAASADSTFCDAHAGAAENHREAADLSATLTAGLAEFKSADAINDFLARLLLLLAQDRISSRRAAVLAYITNQLLRTITVMDDQDQDAAQAKEKKPPIIIWNVPGPEREREGASAHNAAALAQIAARNA